MQKSNKIVSKTRVGPVAERIFNGCPESRAKITPLIPPQRIFSIAAYNEEFRWNRWTSQLLPIQSSVLLSSLYPCVSSYKDLESSSGSRWNSALRVEKCSDASLNLLHGMQDAFADSTDAYLLAVSLR